MINAKIRRAVIYARVSSHQQAQEEISIPAQIERGYKKAEELGANVERVFSDEARSGRYGVRPQFQACLEFIEALNIDYLITWSTSRFSRSKVDAALAKLQLDRAGCEILYISTPIDRSTDAGWVTESVMEVFDEYLSRQIASDTKRSMVRNAEQGYFNGGRAPYGYTVVPCPDNERRRRLQPDPEESAIVCEIFGHKLDGLGGKTIARLLNDDGKTNRGRAWKKAAVARILSSDAVMGRMVFGRRARVGSKRIAVPRDQWLIVDSHEPILEEAVWNEVQLRIERETRPSADDQVSSHGDSLLTGLLWDGVNDCSMQIETATGRAGRRYRYYNSRRALKVGDVPHRRIAADDLEKWMVDAIAKRIFSDENLSEVISDLHREAGEWSRKQSKRTRTVTDRIRDLEDRNRKIFDIMETLGTDTPNLGDVTRRLRSNNDRIKALESELASLDSEQPPSYSVSVDDVGELREFLIEALFSTKNSGRTRALLASFVERITLNADSVEIQYDPARIAQKPECFSSGVRWLPGRTPTRNILLSLPKRWQQAA